jgi:hypothetical protein
MRCLFAILLLVVIAMASGNPYDEQMVRTMIDLHNQDGQ